MKKAFISQPMKGKTKEQIVKERSELVKRLRAKGYETIDSILDCTHEAKNHSVYCLGISLELLSNADIAVFMKGWEYARGCWIEHECCIRYGIPIKYE